MASGAKIYFLSARALFIIWGDTPQYWQWIDHQDSRFSEVAELLHVCWFEVGGSFESKELSRKTNYAAYFVSKTTNNSRGLDDPLYKAILSVGNHESQHQTVCLKRRTRERHRDENVRFHAIGFCEPVSWSTETMWTKSRRITKGLRYDLRWGINFHFIID